MNGLWEQPVTIGLVGIVALGLLAAVWSQTGNNRWLWGMVVVLIATVALIVTERLVVTDQEALRGTVVQLARDVAKNDRQLLYPYIHSAATALRQKADGELPSYEFSECVITKIYDVRVNDAAKPKEATVEFMVRVSGSFSYHGDGASGTFLRLVKLYFTQEADGRWRIRDYEHSEPQQAWFEKQ
jgi:hypothetical protein